MTRRVIKFFAVIILSAHCGAGFAQPSSDDIDRILVLSGFTTSMSNLPGIVRLGLEKEIGGDSGLSDGNLKAILQRVDETFVVSEIVEEVRRPLKESLTQQEVEHLLAWYESDLGKKITAMEEHASTPESYSLIIQQSHSLLARTERVELARRIDEILGVTDTAMEIQENTAVATFSGVAIVMRPETELEEIEIFKKFLATNRPQILVQTVKSVLAQMVFMHLNLDAGEHERYEAFLNLPRTRKFNDIVLSGLTRGLERSTARFIAALTDVLIKKEQEI